MTTGLRTHPKVVRMASALKADKLRIIGGLFAVWSIFDEHTEDGLLEGYALSTMDDEIGWRGFSAAMQSIGWLIESESGLQAPDFDEHNSASAKRRATDTKRKKDTRNADKTRTKLGQMSASDADKLTTREEKRREERYSEAKASGGEPPTDRDLVFSNGVPLLTVAGVSEKNARSMLAGLCKAHGDAAVIKVLSDCAVSRPVEPVSWIQAVLKGKPTANKQSALEARNAAVAEDWLRKMEAQDASQ